MTAAEVLAKVLAAGGSIVRDKPPRLLVPKELKPLVIKHRQEIRRLIVEQAEADGAESARRAAIFREQIHRWVASGRWALPTLVLAGAPELKGGHCASCGARIQRGSFRCSICIAALEEACRQP